MKQLHKIPYFTNTILLLKKAISIILFSVIIFSNLTVNNAQASDGISIYNYSSKLKTTYTGTQVKVTYQGNKISADNRPALILNHIAMVSYYDIFAKSGIHADYAYNKEKGTITISKNGKTIIMTLNSRTALVNGKAVTLSAAPVKIKYYSSVITRILVPAKFVTTTLGYDYSWSSDKTTINIRKKTMSLSYNGAAPVEYASTQGKVTIDGKIVNPGYMPSIIINHTTLVRAKSVFADSKIGAQYLYNKTNKSITISKGDNVITMTIGSTKAYINGVEKKLSVAPMVVKNYDYNTSYVMIPGSFTTKSLGLYYKWNSDKKTSEIATAEYHQSLYGNLAGNMNTGGHFAYRNGWLYASKRNYSVIKQKADGTQETDLFLYNANNLNVTDDSIYYLSTLSSTAGKLYRAGLDGKGSKLINGTDSMRSFLLYGNYIFYINYSDSDRVYRMNLDGTGRIKLSDDTNCKSLNVTYQYVIYRSQKNGIIRTDFDGANRKLLGQMASEIVADNQYIYYTSQDAFNNLYKMKFDGTGLVKLNDDKCTNLNLYQDVLYYTNLLDQSKLYAITTDGTARDKLSNQSAYYPGIVDDYVYYMMDDFSGDAGLYKIKTAKPRVQTNDADTLGNSAGNIINGSFTAYDGNYIYESGWDLTRTLLEGTEELLFPHYHQDYYYGTYGINVAGDYIYYTLAAPNYSFTHGIYKVKKDGSEEAMLLTDLRPYFMTLAGDWIYFTVEALSNRTYSGSGPMYKIRIDGTALTLMDPLNTLHARDLNVVNDYIYYINDSDGGSIYRIKTDGSDSERLSEDENIYQMLVSGDSIYYLYYDGLIKKMPLEGGSGTELVTTGARQILIDHNTLYFTQFRKIYSCNLDGSGITLIADDFLNDTINITAGTLYYKSNDANQTLKRIPLN